MKRKPGRRKKSPQRKLIKDIKEIIRDNMIAKHGRYCMVCGQYIPLESTKKLGLFHIFTEGAHPKLRFHPYNLLLSCWYPCHNDWHHNFHKARRIEKIIKYLKGNDYEKRLYAIEREQPRHTLVYLESLYEELKASPTGERSNE